MTRDEAWAALRAAYPGKTHSICIDIADWDMRHTEPFVWFTVSLQPGLNGGTCWRSRQTNNLAEAVEEAVKMAERPAPVVGEVAAYFAAVQPVPELTPEQTRRFEAALAGSPTSLVAPDGFDALAVPQMAAEMDRRLPPPPKTERELLIEHKSAYLTMGDLDKDFHRPECECETCEGWRVSKGRPTHAELRRTPGFAAPADPAWPTHDENGLKPPAAQDPGPVCRECVEPPEEETIFENQVPRVA